MIYRAAALSRRALQLTETFPVLAFLIYSNTWLLHRRPEQAREARALVYRGARLRDVAAVMDVPMALRHVKPGVAHFTTEVFCEHPELLSFMPDTTPRQRIWMCVVDWAYRKISADFGEWAARHVAGIPGRTHREVGSFVADFADWADPDEAGRAFITRPFTSSMSLKTVTALSADWHEAVANNLDGPNAAFPPAWFPAAKINNTEIVPIEDAATLYREGSTMHHCVGTYRDRVQSGEFYVYSVRRDGERVATLALGRHSGTRSGVFLEQIRGPCNIEPPKEIIATVLRWLRAQKPLRPPADNLMGRAA
jgi:PcfJ-like protein